MVYPFEMNGPQPLNMRRVFWALTQTLIRPNPPEILIRKEEVSYLLCAWGLIFILLISCLVPKTQRIESHKCAIAKSLLKAFYRRRILQKMAEETDREETEYCGLTEQVQKEY